MKTIGLLLLCILFIPIVPFAQIKKTKSVINPEFIKYMEAKRQGEPVSAFVPLTFLPDFSFLIENKKKKIQKSLPLKYDLRKEGGVSSVKDQGKRGACWEFAGIGAIESSWMMMGYDEYNLSELNMGTCHGFEWGIDDGGNMYLTTAYLSRLAGPLLETDDPYDKDLFDPANPPDIPCRDLQISPVAYVPEARWLPNDIDIIKKVIQEQGAVAGNMRIETNLYDYLNATDHTYCYNGSSVPNHAILIVGWDDTKEVVGGEKSPTVPVGAWIVKNSFGESILDNGYFYISYYDTKVFSEAYYFPRRQEYDAADKLYIYDKLGMIQPYIGNQTKTAYGLVKYNAPQEQLITSVGTYISSAGTFVDIEIYSEKNGNELSGLLGKIERQICEYPGYYTFNLPTIVNGDFYIKIKYYTNKLRLPLLPVENRIEGFAHPDIKTGVAWISKEGSQWEAVGSDISGKEMNLCIRAYAKQTTAPRAMFTLQHTEICDGNTIAVSNNSVNNPTSYQWNFGEGSVPSEASTSGPFDVQFNGLGEKTISLTVSNSEGSHTYTQNVNVVNNIDVKVFAEDTLLVNSRSMELSVFADADEFLWSPDFRLSSTTAHTVTADPFAFTGQTDVVYSYKATAKQGSCEASRQVDIKIVMPPYNDDVCSAANLNYGEINTFTNFNATVQSNEPHPDTSGVYSCMQNMKWCNEYGGVSLHNSVWFKFTADNSGVVSIDSKGLDTQMAVYDAATCSDVLDGNSTLLAAFDDFHISDNTGAAAIKYLGGLTPGKTYWVQIDGSGSGVSGDFTMQITNTILDIDYLEMQEKIVIQPNPANRICKIIINADDFGEAEMVVFDINGRQIYQRQTTQKENEFDVSDFESGMYFVKIYNSKYVVTKKLMIE